MLTPYSQPQFVEKIITSTTGEQFRVTFLVAIVHGEVRAKVISAISLTPSAGSIAGDVADIASSVASVLSLPAAYVSSASTFDYTPSFAAKVSPYFNLEFFTSQPTRAPSFN